MSIGNSSMLKVINPDTITEEPLETNNILVFIYHARRANLDIMRWPKSSYFAEQHVYVTHACPRKTCFWIIKGRR